VPVPSARARAALDAMIAGKSVSSEHGLTARRLPQMSRRMRYLISSVMVWLWACAGASSAPSASRATVKEPEWVVKAGGVRVRDGKTVFFGVGNAAFVTNAELKQNHSDNKARSELARAFESFTRIFVTSYYLPTLRGEVRASEEQRLGLTLNVLGAQTLSKVVVVERFIDADGAQFSLATLDADGLEASAQSADLAPSFRAYAKAHLKRHLGSDVSAVAGLPPVEKPGVCTARVRLRGIKRSAEHCVPPMQSTIIELSYPLAGGDIVGENDFRGKIGPSGIVDLAAPPITRTADACAYRRETKLNGRLGGELLYAFEETVLQDGCAPGCKIEAKVETLVKVCAMTSTIEGGSLRIP
jgi:hypothetical protein